jgi:hypothetical protein
MTHASLLNEEWNLLVERLGGVAMLEAVNEEWNLLVERLGGVAMLEAGARETARSCGRAR